MHSKVAAAALIGLASVAGATPAAPRGVLPVHNDFSCKPSAAHPNPVVLLHGLGATYYENINFLEYFLQQLGFCTFSLTYGALDGFPFVGGLKPIDESSQQIADFIKQVASKTGASKLDLVGHSEGAFQSLYTPKFRDGIAPLLEHVVAIAPPTNGTTFAGLWNIAPLLGANSRQDIGAILEKYGCPPCDELSVGGPGVLKLNDGTPIRQPGTKLTIITSKYDQLVTPPETAFVHEDGVNNIFVQDYCPLDPVGHVNEGYDTNVWNLVLNSLSDQVGRKFLCLAGSPGK
ncbi:Lipase, class 2 [Cordyceps fumosorosea ARSEF 2679]|uniref:Lipase, class 2 n=1 Tax=Cordyceps fumosorosea (strain ARSEF 2679) TaxID=1081104 RepID=A0A167WHK4_CORFA|nr:Lipase, class 2 [Cordyceps fumosorosea ARSEF 2679]OAA63799.1 Lipase, class 2 [Cordyceps fumosorosea ARSEF 2679]